MIDLITGHQGVAHISAEQVATVNDVMMYGYGQDSVVRLKDGTVSADGLKVDINTGYWRLNGYDMQITQAESITIEASAENMGRIDVIYAEILQDKPSGIQRVELVTVKGEEAATPAEPSAPTDPELTTDILLLALPVVKCTVSESTMTITDKTLPVSSAIYFEFVGTTEEWNAVEDKSIYDGRKVNLIDDMFSVYIYTHGEFPLLYCIAGNPSQALDNITVTLQISNIAAYNYKKYNLFEYGENRRLAMAMRDISEGETLVTDGNFRFTTIDELIATKNEQIRVINDILGAKNLLPNHAKTNEINGLTFTVNDDLSVTITGPQTATANTSFSLFSYSSWDAPAIKIGETYYLEGGLNENIRVLVYFTYTDNTVLNVIDDGGGVSFELTKKVKFANASIHVKNGATIGDGVTVKPMICPKYSHYDDYVKFAYTNEELTERVDSISRYGTCTNGASATNKQVSTTNGDFVLKAGNKVRVKFSYTNTASSPTLQVDNGETKSIKGYGTTTPAIWWNAGDVVEFVFDGTYFIMQPTQGQISTLNAALSELTEKEYFTLDKVSSAQTQFTGYGIYQRSTNTVRIYLSSLGSVTSNLVAQGIPAKYRPSESKSIPVIASGIAGLGYVKTDGTIEQQITGTYSSVFAVGEYDL